MSLIQDSNASYHNRVSRILACVMETSFIFIEEDSFLCSREGSWIRSLSRTRCLSEYLCNECSRTRDIIQSLRTLTDAWAS